MKTAKEIAGNITRLALAEIASGSKLGGEIGHYLHVQTENDEYAGTPDYCDAVFQAESFCEFNRDAGMLRLVRRLLIAAGGYRVMTPWELDTTIVTRGPVWSFKLEGVPYLSDYPNCAVTLVTEDAT